MIQHDIVIIGGGPAGLAAAAAAKKSVPKPDLASPRLNRDSWVRLLSQFVLEQYSAIFRGM